jgi:hypothetical protein
VIALCFKCSLCVLAQGWIDHSVITAFENEELHEDGSALNDEYFAFGATYDTAMTSNQTIINAAGSVLIYNRDENGGLSFAQKIVPNPRVEFAQFGNFLCMNDSLLIVSAFEESYSVAGTYFSKHGAVYIFKLSETGIWLQTQRIQPSLLDANSRFGRYISLYGNELIIGAYKHSPYGNGTGWGAVFVFRPDEQGLWQEEQAIFSGENTNGEEFFIDFNFGYSVAHDSTTLIIGCPESNFVDQNSGELISNVGSVFVYEKNEQGTWEFEQRIKRNGDQLYNYVHYDYFGFDLAIYDRRIFIRTRGGYHPTYESESFVFEYAKIDSVWQQEQIMITPKAYDFDIGLKIRNGRLGVGVFAEYDFVNNFHGSVTFYEESSTLDAEGQNDWIFTQKLIEQPRHINKFSKSFDFDESQLFVIGESRYSSSNGILDSTKARIYVYDRCETQTIDIQPSPCDSYTSPSGIFFDTSAVFVDSVAMTQYCYHIYNVDLNLRQSSSAFKIRSACDSLESFSGGFFWTESGTYYDTITNVMGCDSIIAVNLTIQNDSVYSSIEACDSLHWIGTNETYYETGTYWASFENSFGCDSVVQLDIEIHQSEFITQDTTVCGSYLSPSGNYIWTASGNYQDTTYNIFGCAMYHQLSLNILSMPFDSISVSACEVFQSPSAIYFWTESGQYIDTIPSSQLCDSLLYIDLEILQPTFSAIDTSDCLGITSPGGLYYWDTSGQYIEVFQNAQGCDSIVTIDLQILNPITAVTIIADDSLVSLANSSAIFQWLDCNNNLSPISGANQQGFKPSLSGSYAVSITEVGCTDTSACQTITVLDIDDFLGLDGFSVFPNPGSSNFTVKSSQIYNEALLKLYDMQGRLVYSKKASPSTEINFTPSVGEGTYLLRIEQGESVLWQFRLVVVK